MCVCCYFIAVFVFLLVAGIFDAIREAKAIHLNDQLRTYRMKERESLTHKVQELETELLWQKYCGHLYDASSRRLPESERHKRQAQRLLENNPGLKQKLLEHDANP